MAIFAKRNNVKPMFLCVTKMMVVCVGWFVTHLARKCFGTWQFAISCSVTYCRASQCFVGMVFSVLFAPLIIVFFATFGLCKFLSGTPVNFFTLICSAIFFCTFFTPRRIMILISFWILPKLRNWKDLFAFAALFGYDGCIHNVSYSDVMVKASVGRDERHGWPVLCANHTTYRRYVNENFDLREIF